MEIINDKNIQDSALSSKDCQRKLKLQAVFKYTLQQIERDCDLVAAKQSFPRLFKDYPEIEIEFRNLNSSLIATSIEQFDRSIADLDLNFEALYSERTVSLDIDRLTKINRMSIKKLELKRLTDEYDENNGILHSLVADIDTNLIQKLEINL